jgi:spermidine/putrescine transport system permease protein
MPRRRRLDALVLALPASAGILLFFCAPFITFALYSFLTSRVYSFGAAAPLTLENYTRIFQSSVNGQLALNSLVVGLAAAVVTTCLAIPVAYWLRYAAGRLQLPVLFLITVTVFASYLVRIYAWRTVLGEAGILNKGLQWVGVIDHPLGFLLYSRVAVIIAMVHIMLPYSVLILFAAFRPLEPRYLDCASDLGASALQRWRRVVLPLVAAPTAIAFMLTFVLSASDYVTPQFLGGSHGSLIGLQIQTYFKSLGNYGQGAALGIVVLVCFLVLYGLVSLGIRLLRLNRIVWST